MYVCNQLVDSSRNSNNRRSNVWIGWMMDDGIPVYGKLESRSGRGSSSECFIWDMYERIYVCMQVCW
jgi:hypothetical protein